MTIFDLCRRDDLLGLELFFDVPSPSDDDVFMVLDEGG